MPTIDVNAAIQWAFGTFKRTPVPYLALAAVVAVIQMLSTIAIIPLQRALEDCANPQSPGQRAACESALGSSAVSAIVLAVILAILAFLASIGIYRAALGATQGITPTFSLIFRTTYLGRYILFALLNGVLVFIGIVLCIVPGLIVLFLLQLGPLYVLARGDGAWTAAKASARAVRRHVGAALLMLVFILIVQLIGNAFYGVLTLLTLPFSTLFFAHMYRQFNEEPIA